MKKTSIISIASFVVLITGLLAFPVFGQTQSTSSSISDLIKTLQQQIETLKVQIEALKQARLQIKTTSQDITETLKLARQLKEGMSGEDVKLLQTILAAYPDIYPEGLISGYYGRLTSQAVKKFQKKFNLEQVGNVGSKTLKKINEELENNPVTTEETSEGKRTCAIVPPGHLIAPGWLKKQDGVKPIVPVCQVLPPGIAKKLGIATSTPPTPDTVAPVISQISATSTTANSTHITWFTNELANSKIWHATTSPVATNAAPTISSADLVLSHDLLLSSLYASTTYYYIVVSSDNSGNTATSSQSSFATQ